MRRRRKNNTSVNIDEIFMDVRNAPGYHRENLEGTIERPIAGRVFWFVGFVFLLLSTVFLLRIAFLQIKDGDLFRSRSDRNRMRFVEVPAERGVIYDRFGSVLANNTLRNISDNSTTTTMANFKLLRRYPEDGFLHVLGFLKTELNISKGVTGLEAQYDDLLRGTPGKKIEEINASGNIVGSGTHLDSVAGNGLVTSLSYDLQLQLNKYITEAKDAHGFSGGSGVVIDINTGEILAIASVPDFDPNFLIETPTHEEFKKITSDPGMPFFNRTLLGMYPPGSIVKPAVASGALMENIIDPLTTIVSTGKLVLPNPYFPDKPSIFLDWKAHGAVDMRRAIAVSSDVYFYEIGGGFGSQKGLGAANIEKYFRIFGLGEKTGIDMPAEKSGNLPDITKEKDGRPWTIGDTYHLSIGQGDLLVTPIQMAVYVAALASRGNIVQPHIAKAVVDKNKKVINTFSFPLKRTNILPDNVFTIIHEGMRQAALVGTASGLGGLSIHVAAKTGTAEIGKTGRVHSWSMGFLPYEKPRVAFLIMMENGSVHNLVGATYVASQMIQWMADTKFLDSLDKPFE